MMGKDNSRKKNETSEVELYFGLDLTSTYRTGFEVCGTFFTRLRDKKNRVIFMSAPSYT